MADVLLLKGDEDIDLIAEVEIAFSIKFDPDELTRAQTVGDLFQLVLSRVPSVEKVKADA